VSPNRGAFPERFRVDFRLSESDREIIRAATREVFLGLALASGDVRIRIADSVLYPGHAEWIERDQIIVNDVIGGFSFIVKEGQVTGFFPSSQMNRTPNWRLPDVQLRGILELLPLSSDFHLY
jgi:hypothetical protein